MSITTIQPLSVIATWHPAPRRWWHEWQLMCAEWREVRRAHARAKALAVLSRATLHDIGMADEVPPRQGLSFVDYERGRW